jgi:hypothetical protein
MDQPGLTMDQKSGPGTPGRTPTPVSGTPMTPKSGPIQKRPSARNITPSRPPTSKLQVPQPINQPLRPGASAARSPVPSVNKTSVRQWYCSRCHDIVSPEAVSRGEASMLQGQPVCARCIRKAAEKARAKSLGRLAGAAAGLGLVAVGIFAPAQFLFMATIISVCVAIVGVLGLTLSANMRAGLAVGGLVFAAAGFVALRSMNSSDAADKAAQALQQDAREVQQLVASDQLADAQMKLEALNTRAREADGSYSSQQAEAAVTQARQSIDSFIQNRYGQLDERERDVLKNLCSMFPDAPSGQRFRDIKVDGTTLRMTVLLNEELKDNQIFDDLKELPFTIFQLFPVLQNVELKFLSPSTQAEAGVCALSRFDANAIRKRMTLKSGLAMQRSAPQPSETTPPADNQ